MATTSTRPQLLTAEDFAQLGSDGDHVELIRGELVTMPPTNFEHGEVSGNIHTRLGMHVLQNHLGAVLSAETGFTVARDPDTVLAPDIAFVRADRRPQGRERRRFAALAPDLVVEVISPSETADEVVAKVMTYLRVGVPLVWVVHPAQKAVTVYTPDRVGRILSSGDALDGGDVLPGFSLPVDEVFPP
jgi:Uma2 family endonuclease